MWRAPSQKMTSRFRCWWQARTVACASDQLSTYAEVPMIYSSIPSCKTDSTLPPTAWGRKSLHMWLSEVTQVVESGKHLIFLCPYSEPPIFSQNLQGHCKLYQKRPQEEDPQNGILGLGGLYYMSTYIISLHGERGPRESERCECHNHLDYHQWEGGTGWDLSGFQFDPPLSPVIALPFEGSPRRHRVWWIGRGYF